MINEKLEEYMKKVNIVNSKVCFFEDREKGLIYPLTPTHLLARLDYFEVGTEKKNGMSEYDKFLFEKKIDKLDYKEIEKTVITPKNEITGNKKDQYTLIEEKKPAVAVWNVSNQVGIFTSFVNKEDAIKLCDEINSKIIEYIG